MRWRNMNGSQRANHRLEKTWARAQAALRNPINKSYRRHYAKLSRRK